MSTPTDPAALEGLIGRLQDAAARLRAGGLTPEQAAELVEQCAAGAAQASAELERLVRAAAQEPAPPPATPDRLC